MKIVQITPGAGGMYCGGCFRDNALVAALRKRGHDTLMVPLYLPLTLDEADQSAGTPIFFSGVNVYLEQKFPWFRNAPDWLHSALASPALLKRLGRFAGKTRAEDVGELTLSMLRGEDGNQAREVEQLVSWLRDNHQPDVVSLSNVLLVGVARRLKSALGVPIVCTLQGEDTFLDGLPASQRAEAWKLVSTRAREVDLFSAPSSYFGSVMRERLGLREDQVRVVHNGISVDGFQPKAKGSASRPVLGYFARMCADKGLGLASDVFIELKKRGRVSGLMFHVGGGCGPSDESFVSEQKQKLEAAGVLDDTAWFPNVTREQKIQFMQSLDVFCTPAMYGEAFGLYLLEAMAAGVPVVQPRHAAFPEIVDATGGGLIAEPTAAALAAGAEELLLNVERARSMGDRGRQAVLARFNVDEMAARTESLLQDITQRSAADVSARKS